VFNKIQTFIIVRFLPPFIIAFLVAWFVFIMQMFWLYIDDLVGKGLDNITVAKLTFYLAPTMVPMALPLGILLAGIMTFGNLAESSQLNAIKSAGISILRVNYGSIFFVGIISALAFLFNNYVIPESNLKFWGLLSDIRNTKPALSIKPGVFYNDIPGYSIYVGKKDADNQTVYDIMIYDHTSGKTNDKVVLAKKGKMSVSPDAKYLIFEMYDGSRYEEKLSENNNKEKEQIRLAFKQWKKVFDLSSFEMKKTSEDNLAHNEEMISNAKVQAKIDTALKIVSTYKKQNINGLKQHLSLISIDSATTSYLPINVSYKKPIQLKALEKKELKNKSFIKNSIYYSLPDSINEKCLSSAITTSKNIIGLNEIYKSDNAIQQLNIRRYKIEWHKKISKAVSCFILFLIGIPLGAIIRKGGFGAPFVVAVLFFVLYHFLNVSFEKVAEQGELLPAVGIWFPAFILSIIAVALFYLANKDSELLTAGYYKNAFSILTKIFNKK
jgi:lipopolysaccharide export system permease protein